MADYSSSPLDLLVANRLKGYVGIHIEQGVPVLDRDLNLLHDLISVTVRDVITRYIGNGSPAGEDGFGVAALAGSAAEQNFSITAGAGGAGRCLVGGIDVRIEAATTYRGQSVVPKLSTPDTSQPDPRVDTVYLDVFLVEIDGRTDDELTNKLDVGMQTSVRLRPGWIVRVAEGSSVPVAPAGHAYHAIAELRRPRGNASITAAMITDRRQQGLTVSDMERRLRRVENALLPTFVGSQFTPKSGFVDTQVVILGTNFNVGGVIVRFGEVVAAGRTVRSPTQIDAGVPRGVATDGVAVPCFISVENAAGRVFAGSPFTVLPAPAFAAPGSQFTPAAGTAGTTVTLNGFNFNVNGLTVQFGTVTARIVGTPTARQIVAEVPPGLVPAGSTSVNVKISVSTDEGTGRSDDDFRADQPATAPAFATSGPQFTPKSGSAGQNVTLNGTNFNVTPVSVRFDTVAANVIGTPTATQIVTQVPAGVTPPGTARGVKVSVTTPGGTAISTDTYTVS